MDFRYFFVFSTLWLSHFVGNDVSVRLCASVCLLMILLVCLSACPFFMQQSSSSWLFSNCEAFWPPEITRRSPLKPPNLPYSICLPVCTVEEVEDKGFNLKLTKKERGDMDWCLEPLNRLYSICLLVCTVEEVGDQGFNLNLDKKKGRSWISVSSQILQLWHVTDATKRVWLFMMGWGIFGFFFCHICLVSLLFLTYMI